MLQPIEHEIKQQQQQQQKRQTIERINIRSVVYLSLIGLVLFPDFLNYLKRTSKRISKITYCVNAIMITLISLRPRSASSGAGQLLHCIETGERCSSLPHISQYLNICKLSALCQVSFVN